MAFPTWTSLTNDAYEVLEQQADLELPVMDSWARVQADLAARIHGCGDPDAGKAAAKQAYNKVMQNFMQGRS